MRAASLSLVLFLLLSPLTRTCHASPFAYRLFAASAAGVALSYTLRLELVLGVILGVRLGHTPQHEWEGSSSSSQGGSSPPHAAEHHRRQTLLAVAMELSAEEVGRIDAVVAKGRLLDGLART